MRKCAIYLVAFLALGVAGGQNTPTPAGGKPGLDELKKQFETTFNDLQRQERETAKLFQQRYLAGLSALDESLQSAGSQLSAVLAVHAEKERFEQSGDIPDSALAEQMPALRKLQDAWRAQTAAVPREQAQKLVAASERFLQSLALLQKDLSARNDARGVAEVNAEKERLLGNNRLREALALLQASAPAAPQRGTATQKPPEKGLVLYFSFDRDEGGKVTDKSGKGNHGTVLGARYTPGGKNGGAYSLSGSNDHITVPNSGSLEIRDKLTLAVWVNLASLGPGGYANEHGYIINKGDDAWWNPTFCLGYSKGGEPLFHVGNATDPQRGGGKSAVGATKLKPGTWYHLVGVYDGATVKLYVNGHLEQMEKYSGRLRADRAPVHLGGGKLFGVDWGNHFTVHGVVDEVMIFDRALTEREVKQLYDVQK